MKKLFTSVTAALSLTALFAQPVLRSDSLHTGLSFNLYSLSNINTANLTPAGANVTWDLSGSTATLAGTADLQDMSATTYGTAFPAANFAIKFTSGGVSQYSLFRVTSSIMEEVANNVGASGQTSFINARTALVFPFTFNSSDSDLYQKSSQSTKYVTNKYDSYGTLITPSGTYNNVVRILINDDGTTSLGFWNTSPFYPILQANSNGVTLWKLATSSTGISEAKSNATFEMYPNPATDELIIINKVPVSSIDVFSISGQLQFSTTRCNMNISELSSGIYFIKVYSVNGVATQKFIKQ